MAGFMMINNLTTKLNAYTNDDQQNQQHHSTMLIASPPTNNTIIICDQYMQTLLECVNTYVPVDVQWVHFLDSVSSDMKINRKLIDATLYVFVAYSLADEMYMTSFSRQESLSGALPTPSCASEGFRFRDKAHKAEMISGVNGLKYECTTALFMFAGPDHNFHNTDISVDALLMFCCLMEGATHELSDEKLQLHIVKRSGVHVMLQRHDKLCDYLDKLI